MTISHTPALFEEIINGEPIPTGKLEYFRTRLRLEFYEFVVRRFLAQENLTKAELARRIHRSPEIINRWLSAPSNWTIDTLSDLLIGMGRVFVSFDDDSVERLISHPARRPPRSETTSFEKMLSPSSPISPQSPPSSRNSLLG